MDTMLSVLRNKLHSAPVEFGISRGKKEIKIYTHTILSVIGMSQFNFTKYIYFSKNETT